MPAAFQSGNIMLFLFSDFRYLCIWHITFLCFGFEVDSFKFLITFFPGSFNNLLAMQPVKYSLNAQFSYFFIAPFVVKSKGCDKCVMLVGTMTHSMFSWSSFELTKYVACSLNDSHKSQNFCETLKPNFFFSSLMYQHMIAWIKFNVSFSLLGCFSLYVKIKPVGNLTAGNDLFVFPLHMSCIGTNSQLLDSPSVICYYISSFQCKVLRIFLCRSNIFCRNKLRR